MREFKNAKELLALCSEKDLPISEIMRQREIIIGEMQEQEVNARMTHVLEIMKEAAFSPIKHPVKSMGGLIGGESQITKIPEKVFAEIFWKELSFTRWQLWKPMLPWG